MTPMDTQVPGSVPSTQLRTWSHALLAAESALLMPRICAPHTSLFQRPTLTTEPNIDHRGARAERAARGRRPSRVPSPLLPPK